LNAPIRLVPAGTEALNLLVTYAGAIATWPRSSAVKEHHVHRSLYGTNAFSDLPFRVFGE
jgi:hypothetical protein